MPQHRKNLRKTTDSKIRIIGGHWRGRKLSVLNDQGLRPTGDRLKETLFNWLAPFLPGAHCLDAYAGTGSLGLEALSRGVNHVHFIENNARTVEQLRTNLQLLQCSEASVHHHSANDWLSQHLPTHIEQAPFDIVFVDPPFAQDLWQNTVDQLQGGHWLKEGALVYMESPKEQALLTPDSWRVYRQKVAGQVCITLYETT